MTPEEREILSGFFDRLAQAEASPQDPEAAAQIRQALARDPQLAYRLTQTALVYEHGLAAAQAQISALQAEKVAAADAQRSSARGSFLPSVPRVAPQSAASQTGSEMRPFAAGGQGFLGSAMRTALGVAGGMALFSGLQGLFDGGSAQAASDQSGHDQDDHEGAAHDDGGDFDSDSFDF